MPENDILSILPAPHTMTLPDFEDPKRKTKTYSFPVLSLHELRMLQDYVNRNYQTPLGAIQEIVANLPEAAAVRAVEMAMERMNDISLFTPPAIGTQRCNEFIQNVSGISEVVSLMLRTGDPAIKQEEIDWVLKHMKAEDAAMVIAKMTGVNEASQPKKNDASPTPG